MIARVIASVSKPLAVGLCVASLATATLAQQSVQGVPNAMQGFSQNRDKPVQISAGSLEVRDKDKTAVWTGEVKVVQGDTTMRSKMLTVYYDGEQGQGGAANSAAKPAVPAMRQATPGPGGNQSIRKLEAKGSVIVTQKDQTVTGDSATFDMKSNTVTMGGGVLLTQGQNTLKGERLTVNLTTGISKVEVGASGRVQGVFQGSKSDSGKGNSFLPGGSSPPAADATPPDRREPGKPLRLNGFPLNSRPAG
jgi:lipopolysaccharide export system protein LptA